MSAQSLLNAHRAAGGLLVLAFLLFAFGGTLPIVGKQGNSRIFTLPAEEQLRAVAGMVVAWRWANLLMGAAIVVLLAGLTLLASILESEGERFLSRLGLVGMVLAAVLWLIFSAFRAAVATTAAQELVATDSMPPYYEPLVRWCFALFFIYAVAGFLALAAFGGAVLRVGLLPAWVGWGAIAFSLATLVALLLTGDTLPAFHYVPPLVMGLILLVRGAG